MTHDPVQAMRGALAGWRITVGAISDDRLSTPLLLRGAGVHGSLDDELARYLQHLLDRPEYRELTAIRSRLRAALRRPSAKTVLAAAAAIERSAHILEASDADRLHYLVAHIWDDAAAWLKLARACSELAYASSGLARLHHTACMYAAIKGVPFDAAFDEFLVTLRLVGQDVAAYDAAIEQRAEEDRAKAAAADTPAAPTFQDEDAFDEIIQAGLDGRPTTTVETAQTVRPPSARVIPSLPTDPPGARGAVFRGFALVAGRQLPFVLRGDPAAQRRRLAARFPHAIDAIDVLLGDLAAREPVRIRPTLLVGKPGAGKTALARALCDALGLPHMRYDAGGAMDSALAGTSAHWSSTRPAVPVDLIRMSRRPNPAIIVDEIDKVADGRHNGSPVDALLAMLEPSQSAAFRDPCLEAVVDLSHVTWLLTANRVDRVPGPLADRCRILEVPEPKRAHLDALLPGVLDDVATDRGIDRRWIADLAADERDLVRRAWPGGSLRRLRRIVETIVDGRDRWLSAQ